MNFPVCNREHTADLSICPGCGAMFGDSVREELIGKVSARLKPIKIEASEAGEIIVEKQSPALSPQTFEAPSAATVGVASVVSEVSKPATGRIAVKPTDQTLVEFHNKNAAVPEWRLQLQNAVRQRQGQTTVEPPQIEPPAKPARTQLVTSGANALKAEIVEVPKPSPQSHPDLARALDRIQKSRQKFLVEETPEATAATVVESPVAAPKANKNYPFYIAAKTNEADLKPAEVNPPIGAYAKPKLAEPLKVEPKKFDTNKLPPLDPHIAENFVAAEKKTSFFAKIQSKIFKSDKDKPVVEVEETEEYEDCPTFAMRFNAGLFDLIIGSFISLCLLAPFMLMGGEWFSGAGFFAFAATASIVMFVYLTLSIGFYGRTFGMRMFSLELVDIEGEEYPTFHQAAVSSSVYLLSLAFGGLGFLTVFFNEEKRAAHDLVSNTIIVRE